jgi:hypothetical protein
MCTRGWKTPTCNPFVTNPAQAGFVVYGTGVSNNLRKSPKLTQTFDFACGLLHCAPGVTGINFANFTQRPLTVRLEPFSQHETDSAALGCASA